LQWRKEEKFPPEQLNDGRKKLLILKNYLKRKVKIVAKKKAKKKAPLGSGKRFKELSEELGEKGASNSDALAAWIGRKKYGKKKFQELAAKGRKKK